MSGIAVVGARHGTAIDSPRAHERGASPTGWAVHAPRSRRSSWLIWREGRVCASRPCADRPPRGAQMTWLVWRQLRLQAAVVLLALAAFALLMLPTGLRMHDALTANGLGGADPCRPARLLNVALDEAFSDRFSSLESLSATLLFVPLFEGMFHLGRTARRTRARARHAPARLDAGRHAPALGARQDHLRPSGGSGRWAITRSSFAGGSGH